MQTGLLKGLPAALKDCCPDLPDSEPEIGRAGTPLTQNAAMAIGKTGTAMAAATVNTDE